MRLPGLSRRARAREKVPSPAPTSAQSATWRGTAAVSNGSASSTFTVRDECPHSAGCSAKTGRLRSEPAPLPTLVMLLWSERNRHAALPGDVVLGPVEPVAVEL